VRERHYRAYRLALAPLGGNPLDEPAYWRLKRRGLGLAELVSRSRVAANREGAFLEGFVAHVEDPANLRLDRLFPGVADTLAALRSRGNRLYLLSLRRQARPFQRQVEDLGIAEAFERVCSRRANGAGQLAKARLIGQLGFDRPAAVVGDTEADILAARRLGLAAIGVPTGLRTSGYLRDAGADVIVGRVRGLPAALDQLRSSPPRA
jgi:phosphoglycolate phosphatase